MVTIAPVCFPTQITFHHVLGAPAAAAARDSLPDSIVAFHSLGSILAHVLELALVSTQHHHKHTLN
jgi:hypothetical protein